ncbi:MAG: alcohol dehydrogenase catalytic domain-containing protein [Calditrichia bacterium]|nr:alcohol dehydrogenase catalytic domain-containing protein [Calditrichia bacterium]
MGTMKAFVFKDVGKMELEDIPIPQITKPDQVVMKVSMCGICGTDVKILVGKHAYKKDTVLGHEFCGVVAEVGSAVTSVKKGDRISVDNNPRCGLCHHCRTGNSCQCEMIKTNTIGIFKNGGYAEYCIAPEDVCFKLPDELDDLTATQVETLATVLNGMNIVEMQPHDSVLVIGFGPIGYLFSAMAKNIAAQVVVSEIDPFRLEIAGSFGVTAVDPNPVDLKEEVLKLTDGKKFDVVIDAVGTELENALKYVTPGGKVLAFGMDDSVMANIKPYFITRNAIKILGSYIGQNTMLPAIQILKNNSIDMSKFFTETINLEQASTAFPKLGTEPGTLKQIPKKAMKIVLQM